jgi:heat shock protein HslJ
MRGWSIGVAARMVGTMRTWRTGLLVTVGLMLVACGDDGASTPDADELDGRTFESTAVEGHELVGGTKVTLDFDDDGLAVRAGCNTMFGGFEIAGGALAVGAMAQTMMACTDDLSQQDQFLVGFFEAGPSITLDGRRLTLTAQGVTITAEAVHA